MSMKHLRLVGQCEELQAAVRDPRTALVYVRSLRTYSVPYEGVATSKRVPKRAWSWKKGMFRRYGIHYCPWTGRRLPSDLTNLRDRVIKQELGIKLRDYEYSNYTNVRKLLNLPQEFFDESWWLRRGIGQRRAAETLAELRRPLEQPYEAAEFTREAPGFWRPVDPHLPHFCNSLWNIFEDGRYMFAYFPWTREYGLRRIRLDQDLREQQEHHLWPVRYCPWCATELPRPLRAEWQAACAARGLEPSANPWQVERYPHGLGSADWWREAGL